MEQSKRVPKWVMKQVGNIISDVAETAKKRPRKVIECSSAALQGWADAYIQLETENEAFKLLIRMLYGPVEGLTREKLEEAQRIVAKALGGE